MISIDTAADLNTDVLREYFKGRRHSPIYNKCKEMYEELKTHADGLYPGKLINERRPHESDTVHEYRKKIYQSKTKETIGSVITSLSKIRRSSDWNVNYAQENQNSAIKEGETLYDYCEVNFPMYGSLTDWVFQVLLKEYLIDPNGIIVVCPLSRPATDLEYVKPYPIIFNSDQIIDYIENQYAVLKSLNKYKFTDAKSEKDQGEMWYVVKSDVIETWAEVNLDKTIEMVDSYTHGLGYIPIIRIKGTFLETHEEYSIWESRISSMVPSLNEAVREYSDLQAARVGAMYPEKWEYASQPCQGCMDVNGIATGKILEQYGKQQKTRYITCPQCQGTGTQATSGPYKKFIVRSAKTTMGEQPVPTPPFGYVPKGDVATIVEAMDKSVKQHKYEALSAINMQFLMQVPLSISGDAKMVDRDELNNFVYGIAEDLVGLMYELYYLIIDYRYKTVVPDYTKRRKLCPEIPVPQTFDLLTGAYLLEDIKSARGDAKLNNITIQAMEIEYIQKKDGMLYSRASEMLSCIFDLDPFPDANDDEKLARKQGGGVTDIDYCISCNINSFVKRAISENEEFADLPRAEQVAKMVEYAKPIVDANTLKAKALAAAAQPIKIPTVPENN